MGPATPRAGATRPEPDLLVSLAAIGRALQREFAIERALIPARGRS
jgi:hypothetical protein